MKLRLGDNVLIISGKDKGKTGRVIRILPEKQRVVVEGVNMRVKYVKKTFERAGQSIKFEGSLAASNVMILDPKTGKPTRIGYKIDEKTGKKKRIALASGSVIEGAAKKDAKKTEKKADKKAESKTKKDDAAKTEDKGAKSPFWKRMGFGKAGTTDAHESHHKSAEPDHPASNIHVSHSRES